MTIKERRLAANYSLTQIAQLSDVNRRLVSLAERGLPVSPENLQRIEQALARAELAPQPQRKPQGFEKMDAQRQRYAAAAGGRKAHELGVAHEFDAAEAKAAGRRGGLVHSPEHMREIGSKSKRTRP